MEILGVLGRLREENLLGFVDSTHTQQFIDLLLRILLPQHDHLRLSRILCLFRVGGQENNLVVTRNIDSPLGILELLLLTRFVELRRKDALKKFTALLEHHDSVFVDRDDILRRQVNRNKRVLCQSALASMLIKAERLSDDGLIAALRRRDGHERGSGALISHHKKLVVESAHHGHVSLLNRVRGDYLSTLVAEYGVGADIGVAGVG